MKISQMMLKRRYDKSNFEVDRPLPKGMNKNVTGLMKGELGEKIIAKLIALRRKTHQTTKSYSDLIDADKNL